MNLDPVAATYAQALLEAAEDEGVLEQVLEETGFLADRLREDADLRLFVENPRLEKSAKKASLEKAFRGRASDTFVNFLLLVVDKGRQLLLRDILEAYKVLHDERAGIVRAEAVSAVPMTEESVGELRERMSARLGKEVVITNRVKPEILGGLVVRFDGMVADGSLRTALDEVRTGMTSHKFGSEMVHED